MTGRTGASRTALETIPAHAVLVPLAYVISVFLDVGADPRVVARPALVVVVVAVAAIAALSLVTGRLRTAGVIVTGATALLVVGGEWLSREGGPPEQALMLLGISALVVAAVLALARWRPDLARRLPTSRAVTSALNGFAVLLVVVVLASGATSGALGTAIDLYRAGSAPPSGDTPAEPAGGPDVFIVILDGYPRADTLERLFAHDNSGFLSELESLGFDVADGSRANYQWTPLTLTSMLHMRHVVGLPDYGPIARGEEESDPGFYKLINENPVFDRFRERGYRIVAIPPGIERVAIQSSDDVADSGHISEFEFHLLRSTLVGPLLRLADDAYMARQVHGRVSAAFDDLEALAEPADVSRLVIGHVLSPHMPAVFHADGSFRAVPSDDGLFQDVRRITGQSLDEWIPPYLEQLEFLNRRVLDVAGVIVEANPDAIVIVTADHGPASHWTWTEPEEHLDERFAILFAARTPDRSDVFTDHQTLVNLFPALLNAYFDAGLELRTDTTYRGFFGVTEVPNPDAPSADGVD